MEVLIIMEEQMASIEDLFEMKLHSPEKLDGIMSEAKEYLMIHTLSERREVEEKSQHDGLTGAHNRAYFDQTLDREFIFSWQQEIPLTLAMIDLDHFKKINDKYGHPAGDTFLVAVVKTILEHIRPDDSLCRYGGEEFSLILPGTSLASAKNLLTRLNNNIAEISINIDDGSTASITASIGVAALEGKKRHTSALALLKAADYALYAAKKSGRNKIICDE